MWIHESGTQSSGASSHNGPSGIFKKMLHWFVPDPLTAVDKAPTGFSSDGSISEVLWENPEVNQFFIPFYFLACFGGNFLWGKPKPAHSHLPPIFHLDCLTENIPVLTRAHKPASVSAKGSARLASGSTTAAASDPNLN